MMESPQCKTCLKKITKKQKTLKCDICEGWIHIKCNKLDRNDFNQMETEEPFYCINCMSESIPFSTLNNNEFATLLQTDKIDHTKRKASSTPSDYQREIYVKLNTAMNTNMAALNEEDDNDENFTTTINCNYYSPDDFALAKFSPSKTFSILHYNIHSVQRHIEEFRVALEMLDFKFDIICLSESLLKGSKPISNIDIEGYQSPIGTPTDSAKGGVLIYVKCGINYKPRNDLNMNKSKELESFFIEINNKKEKNDIIGIIYRHPCMSEEDFNDNHLKGLIDKLSTENKKIFLAGDFNYDLLNLSTNNTFDFFELMMSNFLLPSITLPTKINKGNNTLIDNIFTNHLHPDMKSGNLTINLSDGHLPSFIIIPKQNQEHLPKKHNLYTRNMKNFDRERFISDYNNINWDEVIDTNMNNPNTAMENFLKTFNELLNEHIPLTKITPKQFKQKYKPWISNEILNKIRKKNKLLERHIKSKDPDNKQKILKEFKKIKNEITYLTRTNKKAYFKNYFTKHKNNLLKIWKGIKDIINIASKKQDHPTCLEVEGRTITNPTDISNSFNNYFTSIAEEIINKRKYNGKKSYKDFLPKRLEKEFVFEEFTEKEISLIISSLDISKACGPNSIPIHILQLLKNDICTPLSKIFNMSFKTGIHPDILKISETTPIYKKGSRLLVSNYRPISLLSNINKIFEKLVHTRIYKFLEESQCIYSLQFGFRKQHSTNHALIDITENFRQALDNKKCLWSLCRPTKSIRHCQPQYSHCQA